METRLKETVCRNIVSSINSMLDAFYILDQAEELLMFVMLLAKECKVIYATEEDCFYGAEYRLHNNNDILVVLHTLENEIAGFVCGKKVVSKQMNIRISDIIEEYAESTWRASIGLKDMQITTSCNGRISTAYL